MRFIDAAWFKAVKEKNFFNMKKILAHYIPEALTANSLFEDNKNILEILLEDNASQEDIEKNTRIACDIVKKTLRPSLKKTLDDFNGEVQSYFEYLAKHLDQLLLILNINPSVLMLFSKDQKNFFHYYATKENHLISFTQINRSFQDQADHPFKAVAFMAQDTEGNTPLHIAAKYSTKQTFTLLDFTNLVVTLGNDVNQQNAKGHVMLSLAIRAAADCRTKRDQSIVASLLEIAKEKMDIDIPSYSGSTPLYYACRYLCIGSAYSLLYAGTKIAEGSKDPLEITREKYEELSLMLDDLRKKNHNPHNFLNAEVNRKITNIENAMLELNKLHLFLQEKKDEQNQFSVMNPQKTVFLKC